MRILLVEDEPDLGRQIVQALEHNGYSVDLAGDGEEARYLGETEPYDAVILNLGLPKIDGLEVLSGWRQAGLEVPVVILTARGAWNQKVAGFDAGADQYVTKPFRIEELLARLRAVIRRAAGHTEAVLECGELRLDTRQGSVSLNGEPVPLTPYEYKVLSYLLHHPGEVVSRTELIEHIYDRDSDRDSNTVEVFIRRLRRKLGVDLIRTQRGRGYAVVDPAAGL